MNDLAREMTRTAFIEPLLYLKINASQFRDDDVLLRSRMYLSPLISRT